MPQANSPLTRRLLFAALYFSEGAPIGYIWWAMPTRLRQAGVPVEQVAALTALLTLPWALKFIWAPVIDTLRGRRWGLRCWITAAQILMGLTLLPLAILPLDELVGIARWLLLAHAFSAATQDVAIDALAIRVVPHAERARVTGWMQAGMLIGRALFGGVALAAESWIGAQAVVGVLLGCIWFSMLIVWLAPGVAAPDIGTPRDSARRFAKTVVRMISARSTWVGLAIALTAGAGFETIGGLLGPFLLDRGVSQGSIGWFLALPVVLSMIVGALLGGWAADRIGHRRLVVISVVAIALWTGALATLGSLSVPNVWLMAAVTPIYFLAGSLTAASYALFMDLTDADVAATQFSAFMGATNLCEVWAVAAGGFTAAALGYEAAFMILALAGLIAVPLVRFLPPPRPAPEAAPLPE